VQNVGLQKVRFFKAINVVTSFFLKTLQNPANFTVS
jgi:hypothetical protein